MALDPTLDAALSQAYVRMFSAVLIEFRAQTCALLSGSGFVTFPVDGTPTTFTSLDPLYGTIKTISGITKAIATSSSRCSITLAPPSPTGIAALSDPLSQGVKARVFVGAINDFTGQSQGVPKTLWTGFVDTMPTTVGQNDQEVVIDTASAYELMFIAGEGNRLNNFFHQRCFTGETGFSGNIEATAPTIWGTSGTTPPFAQVEISPTLGDRLAGQNTGGLSNGQSLYPGG